MTDNEESGSILTAISNLSERKLNWNKIKKEDLDLDYTTLFPSKLASELFKELQKSVQYYEGHLTKVKLFGKWMDIPRQQVAFGDEGLSYKFSGTTIPAKPWPAQIRAVKELICTLTGHDFNFVLVNRYRNGRDYIGDHRDDESDLDKHAPIASLSLGAERDFVFKHGDTKKKGSDKRDIPAVKMRLGHGSLLLMNPPTNRKWYHSLPARRNVTGVRINMTFRKIIK